MKKPLILILVILSATMVACAHVRKTGKKKSSPKAIRGISAVQLRRSACFGRCPEYLLTVNSSGLVVYNGIRNVPHVGIYQKNIGSASVQPLLKSFADHRVDTCSDNYTARIADLPGLSYTITMNGKQKKIANASFGPRYLVDLGEEMDALGKVDDSWKKISDTPDAD